MTTVTVTESANTVTVSEPFVSYDPSSVFRSITDGSNTATPDEVDDTLTVAATAPITVAVSADLDTVPVAATIDPDLSSVSASDDTLASAKAIKTYVDAQVATEDTLAELNDTNIGSPAAGHILVYDNSASVWDNVAITADDGLTATLGDGTLELDLDLKSNGGLEISSNELAVAQGISQHDVAQFAAGVADNDFLRIDGTAVEGRSASEVLSDIGGQAAMTNGISNTNNVVIDHASVADNDFAKFTASGLEGRSYSETLSDIGVTVGISNGNYLTANAAVADNDFLKVDGTAVEGRTASEVASDISAMTTSSDSTLSAGVDITTSTTGKIKQKGAFMQSSTHQALFLGA